MKKKVEHIGVYLKLNKDADEDIIKRLEWIRQNSIYGIQSKQGYIKDLIRTDIALDCFRNGTENGLVHVKKG